jgi:hypothetical protein
MAERLTVERAAKALEVSQGSFGKAAAGLPLTKATALFVRAGLARIKEAGEAGGAS